MLDKKAIKSIYKYCGDEIGARWNSLSKRLSTTGTVTIVNTGVVSSGKSSIFNALIGSVETEHFPTGAARTTVIADEYVFNDTIKFVDTPGIDVRTEDDLIAFDTVSCADIVMIVHNIKTGVLTQNEVDWIKRVADSMGKKTARDRMIFVCSWVDERDSDDAYHELLDDIKSMLFKTLDGEIPVFEISAKRYFKGIKENKKALIGKSNIDSLKDYLVNRTNELVGEKGKDLAELKSELVEESQSRLRVRRAVAQEKVYGIREQIKNQFKSKLSAWDSALDTFKLYLKQLRELKDELKNI